jgi:hypothetical protein
MIGYSSGIISEPLTTSGLRHGLALIIALMVISSPTVMLVNPAVIAAPLSKESGGADATPSTISQEGDFTAQAPLQIPRTLQSTDLVNSLAFYEVTFITSTTGAIDKIRMDFPAETNIAAAGVIERVGIGGGTLLKSGSSVTYDVTTPVSIPAGTFIRLEMFGIKNPPVPDEPSLTATITTRDSSGNLIDGPSMTNAYFIRQIGTNDIANNAVTTPKIADSAITSTKPAESFMKKVSVDDTPAGNAVGWNPDSMDTGFTIFDPAVINADSTLVSASTQFAGETTCAVVEIFSGQFNIVCTPAPANFGELHYVVQNLPAYVIS